MKDKLRMIIWLQLGLLFYGLSWAVGNDLPAVQTVFYKIGHVTTLAWVGYWISRQMLGRIDRGSAPEPHEIGARAILVGAIIIAGSLGL